MAEMRVNQQQTFMHSTRNVEVSTDYTYPYLRATQQDDISNTRYWVVRKVRADVEGKLKCRKF